jgi:hypothetical protein
MHDFGDHRQRLHCARTDTGYKQKLGEILRTGVSSCRQIAVKATQIDAC